MFTSQIDLVIKKMGNNPNPIKNSGEMTTRFLNSQRNVNDREENNKLLT